MSRWRLLTGHVDRLADRPAGVVEVRRGVGQLHQVAEVLDRAVAPAAVEVADERRAVVRGEDRVHPADLDVPLRVAGELGELARGRGLDDPAAHPAREADPDAVDVGAGTAERAQSAPASPRNSRPTSSRIVSAFSSMSDRPSSPRTSNGASLRVRNGTCSAWAARRIAWRAARPPLRRRCGVVHQRVLPGADRDPSAAALGPRVRPRRPRRPGHVPGASRHCRGAGRPPSCAGTPSPRRSAPGSAARPRSRSSRRAGRRPRSRPGPRPTGGR